MIINVEKEFQNKLFYDLLGVKTYSNLNIEKTRTDFAEEIKNKILKATTGIIISDTDLVKILTMVNKIRSNGYKDLTKEEKLFLLSVYKGNLSNIAGVHDNELIPDETELKSLAYNDKVMLVESPTFEVDGSLYDVELTTFDDMESLLNFINQFDGDTYIFAFNKSSTIDTVKYAIRFARLEDRFAKRKNYFGRGFQGIMPMVTELD